VHRKNIAPGELPSLNRGLGSGRLYSVYLLNLSSSAAANESCAEAEACDPLLNSSSSTQISKSYMTLASATLPNGSRVGGLHVPLVVRVVVQCDFSNYTSRDIIRL